MTPLDIFLNKSDRLRSGWRLAIFVAAFFSVYVGLATLVNDRFRLLLLFSAIFVGWGCGRLFEDLPLRAVGWSLHRGWFRDLLLGVVFGALSLLLAAALASVAGGFRFAFAPPALGFATLKTASVAAAFWVIPAAAEEAMFRGYPLQTTLRSWRLWLAAGLTSLLFASIHILNPNFLPLAFINTFLAGMCLAVAYWRTRSLWFALGLHWSWNWVMGSLLGLPVSGATRHASASLVHVTDSGPAWLTGGAYGLEGGAACAIALVITTIFTLKTRLLKADKELKVFTDGERPKRAGG